MFMCDQTIFLANGKNPVIHIKPKPESINFELFLFLMMCRYTTLGSWLNEEKKSNCISISY